MSTADEISALMLNAYDESRKSSVIKFKQLILSHESFLGPKNATSCVKYVSDAVARFRAIRTSFVEANESMIMDYDITQANNAIATRLAEMMVLAIDSDLDVDYKRRIDCVVSNYEGLIRVIDLLKTQSFLDFKVKRRNYFEDVEYERNLR